MAKFRYVTHVELPQATITVKLTDGSYQAHLRAAGVSFYGTGKSIRTATEDIFRQAMKVPRGLASGAPPKRYRVARSII